MGLVTCAAVLQGRLMGKTLFPEAGCFFMTGEADGGVRLLQKLIFSRTMGIMAGGAFLFLHRFMFDRIIGGVMTFLTERAAYILQQSPEITRVRCVAKDAVAAAERLMCCSIACSRLFLFFVTGKTEIAIVQAVPEETLPLTPVRIMTLRAFTLVKRDMVAQPIHFSADLFMAGET